MLTSLILSLAMQTTPAAIVEKNTFTESDTLQTQEVESGRTKRLDMTLTGSGRTKRLETDLAASGRAKKRR